MSIVAMLGSWKRNRGGFDRRRPSRSRPFVEFLEPRALLSGLALNGKSIPPTVVGLRSAVVPHRATALVRSPSERPSGGESAGGTGSDHGAYSDIKTLLRPMRSGLLLDGGFETPKINRRQKAGTFFAGNQGLAAWRITAGSVDVQTYWPAVEGTRTLRPRRRVGRHDRTILRDRTRAGLPAPVRLWQQPGWSRPDGQHDGHRQRHRHAARSAGRACRIHGEVHELHAFFRDVFCQHGDETTLEFASTTTGAYGIVLDAVSVTAFAGEKQYR